MIFGEISLDEAEGAILAHSVRIDRSILKKGRRLSAEDVDRLRVAGRTSVVAARLEPGDVHEDEAATRIARTLCGDGLVAAAAFTGRVNLFAETAGLLVLDRDRIDRLNDLDESITVATLPEFAVVEPKQMVATIKIIPFAAPDHAVAACESHNGPAPLRIAPFQPKKVALIQTRLPETKPSVLDKTVVTTAGRLTPFGSTLDQDRRCAHEIEPLSSEIEAALAEGAELILIAGASAITDRRDVLPAGIERAGGTVEHFGMPVDPGNLLLIGRAADVPVLGLPGCARSPRMNGFDRVLHRLLADQPVRRSDVTAMGVGGLLTEIPTRPLPRALATVEAPAVPRAPRIAAIVLAAGQSRRMGAHNKLLLPIDGKPMVAHAVDAALASQAAPVIVVTGHEREAVTAALAGRDVVFVDNPAFADGLSTSLKAGLDAVPETADGAVISLGDMPLVTAELINRLIAAFNPADGRAIVVPTRQGKRGNPTLWDRRFFAEMRDLAGDVGARHLIGAHGDLLVEIETADQAALTDIDTPEALRQLADAPV